MAGTSEPSGPESVTHDDIAGKDHWNRLWDGATASTAPIDPIAQIEGTWPESVIAARLRHLLAGLAPGSALVEVGCANSSWLPYLSALGFECSGIDYSDVGCERARERLRRSGTVADIVCADATDPPTWMLGRFDALVSFGVVEHFSDTGAIVEAFARLVRPGGTMITEVPNMRGVIGLAQRLLSPAVYRIHVPLSACDLADAHVSAGLQVESSTYLLSWNLGVVNPGALRPLLLRRLWQGVVVATGAVARAVERRGVGLRPNRYTSPYVVCAATRPAEPVAPS